MKKITLFLLLFGLNSYAAADEAQTGAELIAEYILNLGTYLGFDVSKPKQEEGSETAVTPEENLLDSSATLLAQQYAFVTILGAVPVNAFEETLKLFVPSDNSTYSSINSAANYTFQAQGGNQTYATPSTGDQGKVSVSILIDQETYQNDPTNQAILNTLGTPNYTFCMNNDGTAWLDECNLLYDKLVSTNVVGTTLPNTHEFYTYDYNKDIIPQLNVNTLISPLMYTTTMTSSGSSGSSSSTTSSSAEEGLTANNQVQQATNFIRYITSNVTPPALATLKNYDEVYLKAINTDGSVPVVDKIKAQQAIATYLTQLRTFAAYNSVPTSNLYFLLSNRMPQQSKDGKTQTSQALSEFEMATKRLYDPKKETGQQWVDLINNASTATVQKEMAVLLSEINYQLYLMNQRNDRILLTESLLLMLNAKNQIPVIDISKDEKKSLGE